MYPCPVCGFLTLHEPPGSYAICDVCAWEDDALQLEFATSLAGGANRMTLFAAQAQFAEAATRIARKHAGAAVPRDRDHSWRAIDLARDHFPDWGDEGARRAAAADERLYYWRETFWNWDAAS
jgi:cysteine-rich CPCC protein